MVDFTPNFNSHNTRNVEANHPDDVLVLFIFSNVHDNTQIDHVHPLHLDGSQPFTHQVSVRSSAKFNTFMYFCPRSIPFDREWLNGVFYFVFAGRFFCLRS